MQMSNVLLFPVNRILDDSGLVFLSRLGPSPPRQVMNVKIPFILTDRILDKIGNYFAIEAC